MSFFAETLSDRERKNARKLAYLAAWFGGFADLLLDSSGIFIIYFNMLQAGNSIIMLANSVTGIIAMLMLIPSSGIIDRFGAQNVAKYSSIAGSCGYILAACAPFFGAAAAPYAALLGIAVFCMYRPLWTVAWYPILGEILLPQERGFFFGFMRFANYTITGVAFLAIGVFMGENPPRILLQIIIAVIGLLTIGRGYFASKIVQPPHVPQHYNLTGALKISVANSPLVGFSVYSCFMMLAFSAVLPLALTYLKTSLGFADNTVQLISCAGIGGCVCGFFFYGKVVRKTGIRNMELGVHACFILIPLALAFCHRGMPHVEYIIGFMLLLGNFAHACFLCAFSQEILALGKPGNATMASAFSNTYMQIGIASGRSAASFIFGCSALSGSWYLWGVPFSDFQTLFLLCSALAVFGLTLVFVLPSVVPHHDDYYAP